jgi:hypothetical protein
MTRDARLLSGIILIVVSTIPVSIFFFDIIRDSPLAVSFSVGRNGGPRPLVLDSRKLRKSDQLSQLLTTPRE